VEHEEIKDDIHESNEEEKLAGNVEMKENKAKDILHQKIEARFTRKITNGKYAGFEANWISRRSDGKYQLCYSGKYDKHKSTISNKTIPKELMWMKKIADHGINLDGRGYGDADFNHIKENFADPEYENCVIGDIITSVPASRGLPELFLIRYLGETMGSAEWVAASDLDNSENAIKSFKREQNRHKGNLSAYKVMKRGITAQSDICEIKRRNNKKAKIGVKNSKGRGRKRIFCTEANHRKLDLKNANKLFVGKNCCLMKTLEFAYPHIFKSSILATTLTSAAVNSWENAKDCIIQYLQKYYPNYCMEMRCEGYIKAELNSLLQFNRLRKDKYIIVYNLSGGHGHAAVWENGEVKRSISKNEDNDDYDIGQSIFSADLKKEVDFLAIFQIIETAGNKEEIGKSAEKKMSPVQF